MGVLRGNRKKNISVTLELNPDESESDVMLSTRNVFKVSAYKMNLSLFLCVNFFLLRVLNPDMHVYCKCCTLIAKFTLWPKLGIEPIFQII